MMKKLMKKTVVLLMITSLLIPCFSNVLIVKAASSNANTLAELKKELASYKAKKASADNNKNKTQSEINASKNSISSAQTEIDNNKVKIEQAKKDIEALNVEIEETKEKINDLIRTYEISSGDNNYLEYIFGATSISDFIVRYSVSEQLAEYNDELIHSYEGKIEENEQLQVDLAKREIALNNKIVELEEAIDTLGNKLDTFIEDARDAQSDIKAAEELIKLYTNMGCGENENFDTCVSMRSDSGFIRPLTKGTITSNFGYRTHPVTGQKNKFHAGIDIGGNAEGTSVYAAASGMVGQIITKSSCGGNTVYVYHTINGVKYTTVYMHLLKIKVKLGDKVTNQTVVGTVGGGAGTKSWDSCSTGPHLHFAIAKGWYGSTYVSYSTYIANQVNPVNMIKFPTKGIWFYSRY